MAVTAEQIAAATDAVELQRLQTQLQFESAEAYKAELSKVEAFRAATVAHNLAMQSCMARQAAAAESMVAFMRQQGTAFDASERGEVMRKVFETLLAQAVKPSSATTLDGKIADAKADAEWLRVEVDQVMTVYDALRVPAAA